jgi:hypothetical protein
MKKKVPERTHKVKDALKKTAYEPPRNTMDVSYNIGQTAGGSQVPDSDDIPGGFAGSREDMLGSLYDAYQERRVDQMLTHQFQKGGKHTHKKKK